MVEQPLLLVVAALTAAATVVWGRSTRRLERTYRRIQDDSGSDAATLARASWRKELHATATYAVLTLVLAVEAFVGSWEVAVVSLLLIVPLLLTAQQARGFRREARLAEGRSLLERRAEEVLLQEDLAPRAWASRLAPDALPDVEGFQVGSVYQAGTGLMAGDFFDLYRMSPSRVAAVIGDVTGHGIEPSITAFQTKYLLRVFLARYRDPGQALEELNAQLAGVGPDEELVSMCVAVFDTQAGTLRYASAGHPAAWLWHDREVRPLRATGPLLTLDPEAAYGSREIPLDEGDMLLLYTDGLTEARAGEQLFGEDRVAAVVRRDPTNHPQLVCKTLIEEAVEFADSALSDDVAILAVRRS